MKFNSFLVGAATTMAVIGCFAFAFRSCQSEQTTIKTEEATTTVVDTIPKFIDQPIPRDSIVLRYKTIKVPVYDTISVFRSDTLLVDSVNVEIPITQKIYCDSTYQAWVSGYEPALDSIRIFQPITTITNTITNTEIRYKAKRWGLGVQVGMGITPTKVEPYIGIGVSYNLFSW